MSCHPLLQRAIQENGLRMTRQRRLILDALHHFPNPATVTQILRMVRKEDPKIEESTVYRTLTLFEQFRLVASIQTGRGAGRWHHSGGSEHGPRLVCTVCGATESLEDETIVARLRSSARKAGFSIEVEAARIPGLCSACRKHARK